MHIKLALASTLTAALLVGQFFSPFETRCEKPTRTPSVTTAPWSTKPVADQISNEQINSFLQSIYDAFGLTGEEAVYEKLAEAAHGDALEYLYLERNNATAGRSLYEADQTIHQIDILKKQVVQTECSFTVDLTWLVVGAVDHGEHLHLRENAYSAALSIAQIEDAWRITDFDLQNVNRITGDENYLTEETN